MKLIGDLESTEGTGTTSLLVQPQCSTQVTLIRCIYNLFYPTYGLYRPSLLSARPVRCAGRPRGGRSLAAGMRPASLAERGSRPAPFATSDRDTDPDVLREIVIDLDVLIDRQYCP